MIETPLVKIAFIFLGFIALLCGGASADTHLNVDAGWGSTPRDGRWTPVFVTASDPKTRNVLLEIEWPVGGSFSMHIQQAMTIGATARTFPLLLPVHGWTYQQATFALIDRDTGKTLAHFPKPDSVAEIFSTAYFDPAAAFVGVSGTQTQLLSFQTATGNSTLGFLPTQRLPRVPLGYDALDVLILNEPNLVSSNSGQPVLDGEQQRAIVDWVRAGGQLILWPGDGGFPPSGPLADVLPATVGVAQNIELSPEDLAAVGLPPRFKSLLVHALEPRAGARRLAMLNTGQVPAYAANLGLGRIVLTPINLAELQIDDPVHSRDLWAPLLNDMIPPYVGPAQAQVRPIAPVTNYSNGYGNGNSRDSHASIQIADFLGGAQQVNQNGFSSIAYALIGLMLVVGPVDWLVLKKIGRRPWTFVTTSGWIVLVTTGTLLAGHLLIGGTIRYQTLRAIDQVGDTTIASTDYVSLDASRSRVYQIKTNGDGWWQPGATDDAAGTGLKLDIDFHQTSGGNTPEDLTTNIWSSRFLHGEHAGTMPPVISADLRREIVEGKSSPHIVGTITNLSDRPLKHVFVEVREGREAACDQVLPHATVRIEVTPMVGAATQVADDVPDSDYHQAVNPPAEADLWKAAAGLNLRRGKRMGEMVATGEFAIVYAETEDPAPPAELSGQKTAGKHYQFLRALVELHAESGK